MTLTPKHLHILCHSLGLDDFGGGREYRNHYAIGPECDGWNDLKELEASGLVKDLGAQQAWGGMHCFCVTDEGRKSIRSIPDPRPKLTRSQQRYKNFLRCDVGMTFFEYLKAEKQFTRRTI